MNTDSSKEEMEEAQRSSTLELQDELHNSTKKERRMR